MKLSVNDTVIFNRQTLKRLGSDKVSADARGTVVSVHGPIVSVDWHGSWLPHENGGTVRTMPAANLTRILSNGAVFE